MITVTPEVQSLAVALLSGLLGSVLGAVVGGWYSYKGATDAAKQQIDSLYKQEEERRKHEKKEKLQTTLNALFVEAKENKESIVKWREYRSKFKFTTDAWDIYKSNVPDLKTDLQEKLLKTYTEIKRHNTLIDYDFHTPHGLGSKDAEIERRVEDVEKALTVLLKCFEIDKKS